MYKARFLIFFLLFINYVYAVEKKNVKFFLYLSTRFNNPFVFTVEKKDGIEKINTEKPIKILIHGFINDHSTHWIEPTKNSYIRKGEENVIAVNWAKDAIGFYGHAAVAAKAVGAIIAELIIYLNTEKNVPLANIHLIGHSLGAHVSAYAGQNVLEKIGKRIGRITGLDPAGPLFSVYGRDARLSSDDADFVDAIHTDAGKLGIDIPVGHADFWPNGGKFQFGCKSISVGCSHSRAPVYFYESIEFGRFRAWHCKSYRDFDHAKCEKKPNVLMGHNCPTSARGNFYLKTKGKYPYGMITYALTYVL